MPQCLTFWNAQKLRGSTIVDTIASTVLVCVMSGKCPEAYKRVCHNGRNGKVKSVVPKIFKLFCMAMPYSMCSRIMVSAEGQMDTMIFILSREKTTLI